MNNSDSFDKIVIVFLVFLSLISILVISLYAINFIKRNKEINYCIEYNEKIMNVIIENPELIDFFEDKFKDCK